MKPWTLENAKNRLSEVVRRALDHEPQLVTRGGRDSVVVIAKEDYERLVAPKNLLKILRESPIARAIADGALAENAFERRPDLPRRVEL